jgi:hypothetical protein
MSTYPLRLALIEIARLDKDRVEVTKNRAPWIAKLWEATSYPEGMTNREPYCAAGVAYCMREWLKRPDVLAALKLTPATAETWRCKSAAVREWSKWARRRKLRILPKNCILKTGDIIIFDYSHIELCTNDDGTTTGPFDAIGYNTNARAARDGEGTFEKPRIRKNVLEVIRIIE